MPKLPPQIATADVPTVDKLVWFYIYTNPGEHSDRSLWAALGVRPRGAIKRLVEAGALLEEQAPRGTKLGEYRAAPLSSSKHKKPAPVQEETP